MCEYEFFMILYDVQVRWIGHKKRRPMIQSPFILMENPII